MKKNLKELVEKFLGNYEGTEKCEHSCEKEGEGMCSYNLTKQKEVEGLLSEIREVEEKYEILISDLYEFISTVHESNKDQLVVELTFEDYSKARGKIRDVELVLDGDSIHESRLKIELEEDSLNPDKTECVKREFCFDAMNVEEDMDVPGWEIGRNFYLKTKENEFLIGVLVFGVTS